VLIIHDGNAVDAYISFLRSAGIEAAEAHADKAVAEAIAVPPDVIVLDFDCDGETIAALQADARTRGIPVVALADLPMRRPPPE
jgi:DNA-binding response OmpR family regulator